MESNASQTANRLRTDPDSDVIENLVIGGRLYFIMYYVVESGILDDLENERTPISLASFCDMYAYNADVTERLLNILESIGIVVRTEMDGVCKYSNSPCTSKYLTRTSCMDRSCAFIGEKTNFDKMVSNLPARLKSGPETDLTKFYANLKVSNEDNRTAVNLNQAVNINELKKVVVAETSNSQRQANENEDTGQARDGKTKIFMKFMDTMVYPMENVIHLAFDLSSHRQVVDLGGGSGLMAKYLADHYPQMSVQVFDLPHVADVARAQFESQNNQPQRVSFIGGNFFEEQLPYADLYILAHVVHNWSDTQIHILMEKIFNSLPPGGEVLVLEKLLYDSKTGPAISQTLDIVMAALGTGRERTAGEYRRMLEDHGFVNARFRFIEGTNYYDAILATKPIQA